MKNRKMILLTCLLLAMMLIITAYANEPVEEAGGDTGNEQEVDSNNQTEGTETDNKTFEVAISFMPSALTPDTGNDDHTKVIRPIFDQLFAETIDGNLDYYLVENLSVSEDCKTYTMEINSEATWSDGTPITVDDFLFTLKYRDLVAGGKSSYSAIEGEDVKFSKIDDKILEIELPQAYGTYITSLSRFLLIPGHAFDNDPSKVDGSDYFTKTDLLTSGPYKVSEINNDSIFIQLEMITIEANQK